jgi:hypothetical protein
MPTQSYPKVSVDRLKELFIYDPLSGALTWKIDKGRAKVGMPVGSVDSGGRLRTELSGKTYAVHHIAFAIYYDRWPVDLVDHEDRNGVNNRISNLREANSQKNNCNRKTRTDNTSGYKGVSWHRDRYEVRIMLEGKMIHVGSSKDPRIAALMYNEAAIKYHGEFAALNDLSDTGG